MPKSRMDIILAFPTTRHAILGERLLLEADAPVRVMPRPGKIAAGCGICLRVPLEWRDRAHAVLERGGAEVQGAYLTVAGDYRPFPRAVFTKALGLGPGDAVAIIGCGGKTSLANRLAMENRHLPILFSTTTRILMPPDDVVDRCLPVADTVRPGVNLACEDGEEKLRGVPLEALERLRPADGISILEADGSRGLPLKGWADHEPVVPSFTTATVGVCAVRPVGMPFSEEMAHRPELFRNATGIKKGEAIGVEHIAAMVGEMFRKAVGRRILFINQVESAGEEFAVSRLAEGLGGLRIVAGSLRDGHGVLIKGEV